MLSHMGDRIESCGTLHLKDQGTKQTFPSNIPEELEPWSLEAPSQLIDPGGHYGQCVKSHLEVKQNSLPLSSPWGKSSTKATKAV